MKTVNLFYGYLPQITIDANLHPEEQINALCDLLIKATQQNLDVVNIYSNSPYIQFNLTLIHAYVNSKIPPEKNPYHKIFPFENKHFEIKKNGDIIEGEYYKGMMSDKCLLNDYLAKSNDDYSVFLNLEDIYPQS